MGCRAVKRSSTAIMEGRQGVETGGQNGRAQVSGKTLGDVAQEEKQTNLYSSAKSQSPISKSRIVSKDMAAQDVSVCSFAGMAQKVYWPAQFSQRLGFGKHHV